MQYRLTPQTIIAILSWLFLLIFLVSTNPAKLPVSFVVVPFVLLGSGLWFGWSVICSRLFKNTQKGLARVFRQIGHIVAVSITFCLALQSIGQLSIRDIVAVVLTCSLGYFYVHRMTMATKDTTR